MKTDGGGVRVDRRGEVEGVRQEMDKDGEERGFSAATGALGFGANPPGISSNLLDKYRAYADWAHMDRLFYLCHHERKTAAQRKGRAFKIINVYTVRSNTHKKKMDEKANTPPFFYFIFFLSARTRMSH